MAKRLIDVVGAALGLLLASPIMAVVALLVRRRLGRPVLFVQTRPGRHGQPFNLLKFRTMTDECDAGGDPLPTEQRLTPFGRRLRSTSLDELPELVNVLRGDMSLVGPRPLRMEYLPRYSAHQARRHEVRPGLTGLAQVSGRNDLSWEERFDLDVWYVDHRSLRLDLKILLRTCWVAMSARGVHAEDGATVEPFVGSPPSATNEEPMT